MGVFAFGHGGDSNLQVEPVSGYWNIPAPYLDYAVAYDSRCGCIDAKHQFTWPSLRRWSWLYWYSETTNVPIDLTANTCSFFLQLALAM